MCRKLCCEVDKQSSSVHPAAAPCVGVALYRLNVSTEIVAAECSLPYAAATRTTRLAAELTSWVDGMLT